MDFDGKHEAMETIRRNDALARRERMEAGAARDRLEKQASVGERSNRLGTLAALAMVDFIGQRSLDGSMTALRRMAQGGGRVQDAGGGVRADAKTQSDYGGDGVSDAMESLSVEDMRHIAAQKWRNRFF